MSYIIEISENKIESLAENAEKMLRYGGKVMQCIDEMRSGNRSHLGEREREYDDYEDYEDDNRMYGDRHEMDRYGGDWRPPFGERRGRSALTGRYVRR